MHLGLASDADITSGAMATLDFPDFVMDPGLSIGDLTGMEYAINLTSVIFLWGSGSIPASRVDFSDESYRP